MVGYTTSTTQDKGARTWGACFVNVGNNNLTKMSDLKVGGYTRGEEEDFQGTVQLQCLDKSGRIEKLPGSGAGKVYTWLDAAVDEDPETGDLIYFTGWQLNGEDAGELTMNANEAFWCYSNSDQWTIVFPAIVF